MNKRRTDDIAYSWAYKLLPEYIEKLEADIEEQGNENIKNILKIRLKEVEEDYRTIEKIIENEEI